MDEQELYQELRAEFDAYDQAVDIASCWEAFTNEFYKSEFSEFYFDRLPELPTDDTNSSEALTPDFTIYFDNQYAIVGEIKRTFPDEEKPFLRTLEGIAKYDGCPKVQTAQGDYVSAEREDIILLISSTGANQIGTRVSRLLSKGKVNFKENLVLLRYWYNQMDTVTRYEFERVTKCDDELRDHTLPSEYSLNSKIGPEGDYGTMITPPKYFVPEKVQKPICNDEPPGQYLATVLWHKIFPEYLSDEEFRQWKEGSVQKIIPFKTSIQELQQDLNNFIKEGQVRRAWVTDALDFLETANLARSIGDGVSYEVQFRGLVQDVGDDWQDGLDRKKRTKELGDTFISRYVEYTDEISEGEEERKPEPQPGGQASLHDFEPE